MNKAPNIIANAAMMVLLVLFLSAIFIAFGVDGIFATTALILLILLTPRKESAKEKLKIQLFREDTLVRSFIIHDSLTKWEETFDALERLDERLDDGPKS